MGDSKRVFKTANHLAARLERLHERRRDGIRSPRPSRRTLTPAQRAEILAKTGGTCHICGGPIKRGSSWSADHVLAHARGGLHDVSNYLPAHGPCNGYRRAFDPEEFQWILKLGVWFRSQITRRHDLAMRLAERFVKHEQARDRRRVRAERSEES
jgi:5-methylcytosine-specific restriction endonuclease McrA